MLRNLGRGFALALMSALSCNDVTMELGPKPPAAAAGTGGDAIGQAGEAPVGSGGIAAGRGGSGAGLGGFGHSGSANAGGEGNDGPGGGCGPTGCFPEVGCPPLDADCKPCKYDEECDGDKPYCDRYSWRCAACRTPQECPPGEACEEDCPPSAPHCDPVTNTCRTACIDRDGPHFEVCSPLEFCERGRAVCVECNWNDDCQYNPKGSFCYSRLQLCVECLADKVDYASLACPPSRPVCHVADLACYPCKKDEECGPQSRCDDGRCVSQQPPQP